MFLAPHASLPINISDHVKRAINDQFKGIVGKIVFDEALGEVYLMMQNGAFQRFVHSQACKEYLTMKVDFSMTSSSVKAMSLVPSVNDEAAPRAFNVDIRDYIKSI
jgi:Regulator of G protein signaling domain